MPISRDPEFQQELQICREWGFNLQTDRERVILRFDQDQLIPDWIRNETPAVVWERLEVKGFLRLGSTNSEALDLASQGWPAGTLVFAEEQTLGRGRKDRRWISPPGAGLYCSLILRPKQSLRFWPLLTLAASVALVDAIKDLACRNIMPDSLDVDIKWPNDVLISGRKCAGILVETWMSDVENPAAVVGFGVNIRKDSIPESLASEAVCLEEIAHGQVPRRQLLIRFLYFFQHCYLDFEQGRHHELLDRWKGFCSMWNGIPVLIGEGETRRKATTCGISEIGALLVKSSNGEVETLFAETIRISGNSKR
ncbi:MAG: biotin--[acetyl-CoA-carboxylase] ligase [Acidobacteria bacterium]|nr:biotin--[acetyl-CoA-carboxylase] ligase [Acidobacteriota bacterium]